MPAGGSNTLFAVTLGDGNTVVARIPTRGHGRFHMERSVMEAAHKAGIPVPEVLDLLNVQGPGPPIMLISHVAGAPLEAAADLNQEEQATMALAVGRTLAMIHSLDIGTGYGNLDSNLRGSATSLEDWFVKEFLPVAERVAAGLSDDDAAAAGLRRALDVITDNRHLLARDDAVLLHGDYRPGNLLFNGTTLAGVIDWEAAKRGPEALDFGWWDWATRHSGQPFTATALIEGYLQVRPLDISSLDELRRVTLARISIGHLDWALRSGDDKAERDARMSLGTY